MCILHLHLYPYISYTAVFKQSVNEQVIPGPATSLEQSRIGDLVSRAGLVGEEEDLICIDMQQPRHCRLEAPSSSRLGRRHAFPVK